MIRCKFFQSDIGVTEGGDELIAKWRTDVSSRLWVDIEIDDPEWVNRKLAELNCHPLAVQDALRKRHPPKIEAFEEHLFILYRGILEVSEPIDFQHQSVAFFISENLLVSLHPGKSIGVDYIWTNSNQPIAQGTYDVALAVMHYSSGKYLETILQFESVLSDIEDELQSHGNDEMLANLTSYRSKLLKLKRTFNYQQNITKKLLETKRTVAGINVSTEDYLHLTIDVHERFERLYSLTQMHYEICGDLIEGYLSIASHQLNVTMRILTVITAIFVPLSFMAGLYGMNFEYIPELKMKYGYFYLLGSMLLCATGLILFFKQKRWF